jgi:hypothetical protein
MTMAKFLSERAMQRTDEVVKYSYSRDEEGAGVADFRHAFWLSSLRGRDNARVALAREGWQAARTKQAIQAQNVGDKAKRG